MAMSKMHEILKSKNGKYMTRHLRMYFKRIYIIIIDTVDFLVFCSRTCNIFTNFTGFTKKHNFWNNWAMKTTQAILKSQDLLLPTYNKHNIIYIEIVQYWRWQFVWNKSEKIQKVSFGPIFLHWRKKTGGKYLTTQYNNISGTRYTYSRRKTWKYNIWWLPGQFYTHIMYCRSQSELRYPRDLKNMNIWCDFTWLLLEFSILI